MHVAQQPVTPEDTEPGPEVAAPNGTDLSAPVQLEPRRLFVSARLRNGFERLRGDAEAFEREEPADEQDPALELMLLREENARLKAEVHRPSGVGTMIDQLRVLAAEQGPGEALDEVWTLLGECLVIREGLDRACTEIQSATAEIQDRLARLAIQIEEVQAESNSSVTPSTSPNLPSTYSPARDNEKSKPTNKKKKN